MIDFFEDNYVYFLVPLISGLIGYITNVLSIKMTFYPLDFVGIKPFLGWQGILPSKATKMAEKSVDLLTRDLFKPKEVFERLDVKKVENILHDDFLEMSANITDSVMKIKMPIAWEVAGIAVRGKIKKIIAFLLPEIVENSLQEIKENIDKILDLKLLAVNTMKEDKAMINKIFLDLGGRQFRFIEVSGFWLGMLFGIGQNLTSLYTTHWLMFAVYGVFIGFITNWLAIKLIFEPAEPKKVGPFKFWGLFLRNQKEESYRYSQIIATEVLTNENLFDYIFRFSKSEVTKNIIFKYVSLAVDKALESQPVLFKFLITNQKTSEFKSIVFFHLINELPLHIRSVFTYTEKALNIQNTIGEKMANLPPKQFIDFLRPAFQEDEWKLIAVGAALGGVAGILQSMLV
ncbi:MAG: hypothetical protein II956_02990 [Bacteroidales bacterium]|nr:hypothetical protein [Bacteroidales bacterium]